MESTCQVFELRSFLAPWSTFFACGAGAKQPAVLLEPTQTREASLENRRRILVVDDHLDTLRSMELLLTRLGYHVLRAENMTDALRIAEEEPFDILLSDIGLPDGSGLELIRRIRAKRKVSALALSGFGMDEDVQRSRDAGFVDHLTKPVSIDRLRDAIAELEALPS